MTEPDGTHGQASGQGPQAGAPPPAPRPTPASRRRHSRRPYAIAVVLLGFLVASAWLVRGRFQPLVAGSPTPSFTARTLDGRVVGLEDYADKVVLLNVWATWCLPCREEMPSMERLYRDLGDQGFEILAVSVDRAVGGETPVADLEAFVAEYGLTFPVLHDHTASIERIFQTSAVPESFLIGPDGIIYRRIAGATAWDSPQYREQILRLLGQ